MTMAEEPTTSSYESPADTLDAAWAADLQAEETGPEPEAPQATADTPEAQPDLSTPGADPEAEEGPEELEATEEESDEPDESEEDGEFIDLTPDTEIFTVQEGDTERPVTVAEAQKSYMRQADYSQKTEAVARERQQVEAQRQFIDNELGQRLERIQTILPELEARVNSSTSAQELNRLLEEGDTAGYIQRKEAIDAERAGLEAVRAEEARIEEARRQAQIPVERARLLEKIPEWKDPERMAADWPKMLEFAGSHLGITPDEWQTVGYDHRFVTAIEGYRRYLETTRRVPVVEKKLRKLPKTARPSAPRSAEGKQEAAKKAAAARLKKGGGVDDLANLFLADGTVE
jgi:hypothetical protein